MRPIWVDELTTATHTEALFLSAKKPTFEPTNPSQSVARSCTPSRTPRWRAVRTSQNATARDDPTRAATTLSYLRSVPSGAPADGQDWGQLSGPRSRLARLRYSTDTDGLHLRTPTRVSPRFCLTVPDCRPHRRPSARSALRQRVLERDCSDEVSMVAPWTVPCPDLRDRQTWSGEHVIDPHQRRKE